MVDARLPSQWLTEPDIDLMSDRAWRTFTGSLMWSNGAGTDGRLPVNSLRFFHPLGVDDETVTELINAGCWAESPTGYQIVDWAKSQSLAAEVNRAREQNRRRQAAWRERHAHRGGALSSAEGSPADNDHGPSNSASELLPDAAKMSDVTRDITHDETGDISRNETRESLRQGKDRLVGSELEISGGGSVTREAHLTTKPRCSKHPDGTSEPCADCRSARLAAEAEQHREQNRLKAERDEADRRRRACSHCRGDGWRDDDPTVRCDHQPIEATT